MKYKVTTVVDNSVKNGRSDLIGEHGISFFIEKSDDAILFDTGAGNALPHNAAAMGIDLDRVSTVVLSHGHYDHAGGLKYLVDTHKGFTLKAHLSAFDKKYSYRGSTFKSTDPLVRDIGAPFSLEELNKKGVEVKLEKTPIEIAPGIMTTGEIPMTTDFESVEDCFYSNIEEKKKDTMLDDQGLILDTEKGIAVLVGCAHRGIINTLEHVVKLTGRNIYAVMGGLHLIDADENKMQKIVNALHRFDLKRIGASHCTGDFAVNVIQSSFPETFFENGAGHIEEF